MTTKRVRYIITYTISEDDAREAFTDLLNSLDYEGGDDQSTLILTMGKDYYDEAATLSRINELASNRNIPFTSGDQFSFYSIDYVLDNGARRYFIKKNLYRYLRITRRFI